MGSFSTRTRPSLICTHDSSCHVSQLPVPSLCILNSPLVQMYSMPSLLEASCYESFLVSRDVCVYCMLDFVDPHPRHHSSWIHTLLPFLLGYFFIARRICINDVTQQFHITRVCLRPLSFFGSLVILFFILDDFSCPRWSSSLEVDLLLSYILLKLFLMSRCIWP